MDGIFNNELDHSVDYVLEHNHLEMRSHTWFTMISITLSKVSYSFHVNCISLLWISILHFYWKRFVKDSYGLRVRSTIQLHDKTTSFIYVNLVSEKKIQSTDTIKKFSSTESISIDSFLSNSFHNLHYNIRLVSRFWWDTYALSLTYDFKMKIKREDLREEAQITDYSYFFFPDLVILKNIYYKGFRMNNIFKRNSSRSI